MGGCSFELLRGPREGRYLSIFVQAFEAFGRQAQAVRSQHEARGNMGWDEFTLMLSDEPYESPTLMTSS